MAHASSSVPQSSFMKSLFFGQIREDIIFPFPRVQEETAETVRLILESVGKFAQDQVKSSEWDEKGEMPREILSYLAELGIMGLAVPEEFGGLGLPQSAYARVMQEVSSHDGSLAVTLGAHQSIGYKALLLFGTEEQKIKWLPRLASGQLVACYCLTEPGSGSDAASIKTRAVLSEDGRHFEITGNKLWITNGGIAGFMTIFAKTEIDGKEKVSCFALELPAQGVTTGPAEHKLGIRASWTNAVHFDRVKVPVENIIGGMGQGFKVAMGVLNHGRLGLGAGCVGGARNALKASIEHANERVQFGKKIGEFGMVQEKIGRMMMNLYVAESMVFMTTALIDRKDVDYSLESAAAKIFASEMLWESVDENLQIWAGSGYMKEYPYERWLRDARINRIFEGTNEILRAFIGLSGMQGPGQELKDVASGLSEMIKFKSKGMGPVSDFAIRKIKQNVVGESITQAHPSLKKMAGVLEEYAVEFATQIEVLLRRHGKDIFLKQFAQKRVADIAIDFYAMSCVLSRVTRALNEKGVDKCELELSIAEAFFMRANRRVRGNFKAIDRNDDDAMKMIANKAYELGQYPFDSLNG